MTNQILSQQLQAKTIENDELRHFISNETKKYTNLLNELVQENA